jgi:hypothetical protein
MISKEWFLKRCGLNTKQAPLAKRLMYENTLDNCSCSGFKEHVKHERFIKHRSKIPQYIKQYMAMMFGHKS